MRYIHRHIICGNELEHVFDEKDLGVRIDSALSFEEHISEKVKKANMTMGLIRCSFSYFSCKLFKERCVTFVRPHLEYPQVVWSLHLQKFINLIESVQIRATKYVDGLRISITQQIEETGASYLIYRRARGDIYDLWNNYNVQNTTLV